MTTLRNPAFAAGTTYLKVRMTAPRNPAFAAGATHPKVRMTAPRNAQSRRRRRPA